MTTHMQTYHKDHPELIRNEKGETESISHEKKLELLRMKLEAGIITSEKYEEFVGEYISSL